MIELPGLIGSNPLGAMAAFGLLRVVTAMRGDAKLRFVERDDWVAELSGPVQDIKDLVHTLDEWMRSRGATDLDWASEDVRVTPGQYQEAVRAAMNDPHATAFLAALATDGAVDKAQGLVKPTRFYMASGQQSFVRSFRNLRQRMAANAQDSWREALIGPWTYSATEWGGGWDPATERMHALRHRAPTRDKTTCVAGAVWLAYEALPLFPTFTGPWREATVGFVARDRESHWRWPIPSVFIALDALSVLVASADVADGRPPRKGVAAVYESTRSEFGQGYAVFRPSQRVV